MARKKTDKYAFERLVADPERIHFLTTEYLFYLIDLQDQAAKADMNNYNGTPLQLKFMKEMEDDYPSVTPHILPMLELAWGVYANNLNDAFTWLYTRRNECLEYFNDRGFSSQCYAIMAVYLIMKSQAAFYATSRRLFRRRKKIKGE